MVFRVLVGVLGGGFDGIQKITQDFMPVFRGYAFGVELHPINGRGLMGKPHNRAVFQPCGYGQIIGECRVFHDKGMIACCLKRGRHVFENPRVVVVDNTHFAMDYVRGTSDGAAEGLGDGLMPQTHAQQGDIGMVGFGYQRQANPRFIRVARTGGEDYCRGVQRDGFVGGDCIVAFDSNLSAQFAKVMYQIIGETVVVID